MTTPIALTIAGSDSCGGAGIQADLKTFSALGVHGASAITALTAQNTQGVQSVYPVPAEFVTAQIDSVMTDLEVGAIKLGMLGSEEMIHATAAALGKWPGPPVILDPVMVAGTGDPLLNDGAEFALRSYLFSAVDLITPNLPEAARLLSADIATSEQMMLSQGELLLTLGAKAVLIKGGHSQGADAVDLFFDGENIVRLAANRIQTRNTHGTGCTLSSAIAAYMARGLPLLEAVQNAKTYVTEALIAADTLQIGKGAGPVHHFHMLWKELR